MSIMYGNNPMRRMPSLGAACLSVLIGLMIAAFGLFSFPLAIAYDDRADVAPDQPWLSDGTADATPLSPFPDTSTRNLPLIHMVVEGPVTIYRADFPRGVVVIPQDSQAFGTSYVLPLTSTSGNSVTLGEPFYGEWPDGIVVWFTN